MKTFFVQKSEERLENEYNALLEQCFALVYHGSMSISDQIMFNREDRDWFINRLKKQKEDENNQRPLK